MVTCVPGQSACTASASTCAASCRINSSARGSSRLRNSILASRSIGSFRSVSTPSSAIATVRLASEGEMPLAISKPVMPWGNSRRAPSGKVNATISVLLFAHSLPTNAGKRRGRCRVRGGEYIRACCFANPSRPTHIRVSRAHDRFARQASPCYPAGMKQPWQIWRDRRGRLSWLRIATLALLLLPIAIAAYAYATAGLRRAAAQRRDPPHRLLGADLSDCSRSR